MTVWICYCHALEKGCLPADAVRVVEAGPVKEHDGLVIGAVVTRQQALELPLFGVEPLLQRLVFHVGEPHGRFGQPPLGVSLHERSLQALRSLATIQ